jgi:hypothetical protein
VGSVWGFVALIVIAALLLAFGLAQHTTAFLVLGFLLMATAGIFGVKGRLPEQH